MSKDFVTPTQVSEYAFPIPADYCLVLKAIHEASSLREAAILLDMDAGALARKVQKIATDFGLFYKVDNRWMLTEPGLRMVSWVGESLSIQKKLLALRQVCRITTTNWLLEKMLLANHKNIIEQTGNQYQLSYLSTANSLEAEVLGGRTEFAISLHSPYSPEICYKRICKVNWNLIFPASIDKSEFAGKSLEQITALISQKLEPINVKGFEHDLQPNASLQRGLEVDDHATLLKAVEKGLGWGIVPEMLLDGTSDTVGRLELGQDAKQTVNIWWIRSRKDLGQLAEFLSASMKLVVLQ